MIMFAVLAAVLSVEHVPQPADAASRPPIEAAEIDFLPELRGLERTYKEAGISSAGIVVLMTEFSRSGPNQAERDVAAKVEAADKHWEATRTHSSPRAIDVVSAARDARAATRELIDLLAGTREKLLLQLSPPDLRAYLDIDSGQNQQILLGRL